MTEPSALPYSFEIELAVRDYECDLQGIVNNAVYQNYLEHARHEYLKTRGLDFAEITQRGINLVVVRVELDYLRSLCSGDRFLVRLRAEQVSRLRFGFQQDIYRLPDETLVLKAKIIGTGVNAGGRPALPADLLASLL